MSLMTGQTKSSLYGNKSPINKSALIFAAAAVVLLLTVVFLVLPKLSLPSFNLLGTGASSAKPSGYQAVFLANGQVYFGKLSDFAGTEPILRDVYYLKVGSVTETPKTAEVKIDPKDKPATGSAVKATPIPTPSPKAGFTLVKLGEEIHGPQDEIKLNKDQILFVENLRDDSQVVSAIKRYQDGLKKK